MNFIEILYFSDVTDKICINDGLSDQPLILE